MENLKKQIIELLSDASEQYGETYEQRCVYDNDFEKVAEAIFTTLSTQHAKMLDMLTSARATISRLKLSMLVHPDCTDGSEFDDRTTDAQKIEEEIETLLSSIKKGGSDES